MKKRFSYLVLLLLAGLYIDIDTDFDWPNQWNQCNGNFLQRTILVQTIVPFRPERENFYFGIGNKHYDHSVSLSLWCSSKDKYLIRESEGGCAVRDKRGNRDHFFDLRFWDSRFSGETKFYIDADGITRMSIETTSRQMYEQVRKEFETLEGRVCGEDK